MKSEWRVREIARKTETGPETVYGVYRLRDAAAPDERGNREWMKKDGFWAYCRTREAAERYANIFNALEKKGPPPVR